MKIICKEAVGHKLQRERKEVSDRPEDLLALAVGVRQGNQRDAFREVRAAQEILVSSWNVPEILVWPQVLDVRLHQRRILPDLLAGPVFVCDHPVDHVAHGPRLIGRLGARRRGKGAPARSKPERK